MWNFQFGKGIKYYKKIRVPFSRPVSTTLPSHPISSNRPALFPPLSRCQAGPGASWTSHVSLTSSWRDPLRKPTRRGLLGRGNSSPFPCSSPHHPLVKFRPRPVPRCSIQVTVGCPVASPRLPPHLLAAVKLHCPLALLLPPLRLCTVVAAP
jgi:hypothetical protein